jgi:hypothetical protein
MPKKIAEDALQVRQDIIVPVANDHNALLSKPSRAAIVGLLHLFRVLPAVDLHRQAEARAIEVDGEGPDRMLPPEMKPVELIAAKRAPQPRFSVGHVAAEISRPCGDGSHAGKA